ESQQKIRGRGETKPNNHQKRKTKIKKGKKIKKKRGKEGRRGGGGSKSNREGAKVGALQIGDYRGDLYAEERGKNSLISQGKNNSQGIF
ncbi:phosphoinositide 4-kinase gamma 1, partial [Prunus dulcis]